MKEEAQITRPLEIQVVPERKPRLSDTLKIGRPHSTGTSNKMLTWAAKTFPNVKTAHDAFSPIKIRVQARDSGGTAKQKAPNECAFARAACRELDADGAYIGLRESCVIVGDKVIRFQTPESVRREIVSFDRHRDFQPGEYQLSAVLPHRRLGKWLKGGKSGSRKKRKGASRSLPGVFHQTVSIRKRLTLKDMQ